MIRRAPSRVGPRAPTPTVDGSDQDYRQLGYRLPLLRLTPW
jgi:hypothetical protein